MKKWMGAFLIIIFAVTLSVFLFIPDPIIIHKSVTVSISQQALRRIFIENRNWSKGWWSNNNTAMQDSGRSVIFNGTAYSLYDRKYSSVLVAIHRGNDTIATSSINIAEIAKGSVKMDWVAQVPASYNPVRRFESYHQSKKIETDLGTLLNKIGLYFSKPENVYGITIRQEPVMDSTLLSIYDSSKGYPKVEFIYSLINRLKNYVRSHNATATGYPMLNIFTQDSIFYLVKVALPVDKKLPAAGKIAYKWMLPRGNILVTEVKGDSKVIESAFEQMDYYVKDFGRDAPAIPFLSLVTDREQEKDSTKWITRIYYPVME